MKAWQDIWARTFSEVPLRVTLEYLIQSELDWLNQDFKHLISNQAGCTLKTFEILITHYEVCA